MKILQVHNKYMAGPGGEDVVVEAERSVLMENGHVVEQYLASNSDVNTSSIVESLRSGIQSVWSSTHYGSIQKHIDEFKPDLVHVHNTFAAISPSVFWAIKSAKIPCVVTLHNYRLICATGTLFRNGQICEKCVGQYPLAAFQYRCRYKGSALTGSLIATTQVVHRRLGTYSRCVDAFIVLSVSFAKIMKRSGLPADRIHIKLHSVPDIYEQDSGSIARQLQVIYVGQIIDAKGVDVLLETWSALEMSDSRLVIVGDGPARARLQARYNFRSDIVWLGGQPREKVLKVLRESRFLVMPSRWYEPFGLSSIEALMLGTPLIVPNHLSFASIIDSQNAGFIYDRCSVKSLSQILEKATQLGKLDWDQLSRNARQAYLENFTPAQNYKSLMAIYDRAIKNAVVQ